jgi:curli biogenesis system outer membrane secretion channel CsgG
MNTTFRLAASLLLSAAIALDVYADDKAVPETAEEIIVAVIDFDNVSGHNLPSIGRVAHDVLNGYLVGLPSVSVVTRDKLDSVLKEQDLGSSGLVGNRAKSTQLAGLLGADYMITGAVLQYDVEHRRFNSFGVNTITAFHRMKVSLQIVDLETARLSFSKTYDLEYKDASRSGTYSNSNYFGGRERDVLDLLVKQASGDLQDAVLAHTGVKAPGTMLKIPVTSVPPGADIEINGVYIGSTPADVEMEEGVQLLKVVLPGYRPWERKVKVSADLRVSAALAPLPPEEKITIEHK